MEVEAPLTVVIAVDGLRAAALGTYGNTTHPTPHLDHLAATASVAEWFLADSPRLEDFYHAAWQGKHSILGDAFSVGRSLSSLLQAGEVKGWFYSDAAEMVEPARAAGFSEVQHCTIRSTRRAEEVSETAIAQFFTAAIEPFASWLKDASQGKAGSLLWLHLRGLTGPWDAPDYLREAMGEDEEATGATIDSPPESITIEYADQLFDLQLAYAAQVAVLDACLRSFFASTNEICHRNRFTTMLVGTRGFSLGEHGQAGYACDSLYGEQIHLPWLVSPGETGPPLPRLGGFLQPHDLGAPLVRHLNPRAARDVALAESRQFAVARGPQQQMLRTPAWMHLTESDIARDQLFAKPDDRWEMNDVASLCPDVVRQMQELVAVCQQPDRRQIREIFAALPDELLRSHR